MEGGITGKGFKPGQSGNPAGRPKGLPENVRNREGRAVFERLLKFAKGEEKAPKTVQVQAAKIILGYCWGLPVQTMQLGDENNRPLSVSFNPAQAPAEERKEAKEDGSETDSRPHSFTLH